MPACEDAASVNIIGMAHVTLMPEITQEWSNIDLVFQIWALQCIQRVHPNSLIWYFLTPCLNRESFWSTMLKTVPKFLFLLEEQGGISEDPWVRIHKSSLHASLLLADTPPYWISVIDWMLQLIGLIWYIKTSLEFHTGVSTDNRLNSGLSLPSFIFDLFSHHLVKNLC